ncbi:MAG: hypothetical protein ACO1NK_03545 [Sediminibacterium sp.]
MGLSSNNRISKWEKGLANPNTGNAMKFENVLNLAVVGRPTTGVRKIKED